MKYQCEFTKVGNKLLNFFFFFFFTYLHGEVEVHVGCISISMFILIGENVNDSNSVYCCCFVRLFLLMSPSHYIVPCGINKLLLN